MYSVKGKMNYVNSPTDVLKEFRDGAITTSSGRQFQVWTEFGAKECRNDVVRQKGCCNKTDLEEWERLVLGTTIPGGK